MFVMHACIRAMVLWKKFINSLLIGNKSLYVWNFFWDVWNEEMASHFASELNKKSLDVVSSLWHMYMISPKQD
jgi:hypothetical protein